MGERSIGTWEGEPKGKERCRFRATLAPVMMAAGQPDGLTFPAGCADGR
jgi:hypothetical protein